MRIHPTAYLAMLILACFPAGGRAAPPVPWSYDGLHDGQDTWGSLSLDYRTCELGREQSPIIIAETEKADLPKLEFTYVSGDAVTHNDVRGPLVTFPSVQKLVVDGVTYRLKYFVMRAPAEHVAKGQSHSGEVQFVHEDDQKNLLIVAVFLDLVNRPIVGMHRLLEHIPQKGGKETTFKLNPSRFLPARKGYFSYMGSLNMPPCTEKVKWIVMKDHIGITEEQYAKLSTLAQRNSRLTQPILFRKVKESRD